MEVDGRTVSLSPRLSVTVCRRPVQVPPRPGPSLSHGGEYGQSQLRLVSCQVQFEPLRLPHSSTVRLSRRPGPG
eukprot:761931-Hanusia_phi.AAC.1